MASTIDESKPIFGNPTTESVRDNFAIAKNEISFLQALTAGAPFLPLGGGTMTGGLSIASGNLNILAGTINSAGALSGFYFADRTGDTPWALYAQDGECAFYAGQNIITFSDWGINYPPVASAAGLAWHHRHAFGWTGSRVRMFVDNAAVGDIATTADVGAGGGPFLPLAGGAMIGVLAFADIGAAPPEPDNWDGIHIRLFGGVPGVNVPMAIGLELGGIFFSGRFAADHFSWYLGARVAALETPAAGGGGTGGHGDTAMFLQIIDSTGRQRLARVRVEYDPAIAGGDATGGWLVVEGI